MAAEARSLEARTASEAYLGADLAEESSGE